MSDVYETASEDVVEKAKADKAGKRNIFARVALFFTQVYGELRKVTRPTWKELLNYTGVVLAFVTVVMIVISAMDVAFAFLVNFAFKA
ncbi:MAG: preprotein translocase subunit SecE [Micrococcales bacterium]